MSIVQGSPRPERLSTKELASRLRRSLIRRSRLHSLLYTVVLSNSQARQASSFKTQLALWTNESLQVQVGCVGSRTGLAMVGEAGWYAATAG